MLHTKKSFFESQYFIYAAAAFMYLFWHLGTICQKTYEVALAANPDTAVKFPAELIFVCLFVVLFCYLMITRKSTYSTFTLSCLAIFGISLTDIPTDFVGDERFKNVYGTNTFFIVLAIGLALMIASTILHYFLHYKPQHGKLKDSNKYLLSMGVLLAVVLCAGPLRDYVRFPYNFMMFGMYVTVLWVWLMGRMSNFTSFDGAKLVLTAGVLVAVQLVTFFAADFSSILSVSIVVGWGLGNTMSTIMVLAVPMAAYLYVKQSNPVYIVLATFISACLIPTFCRGHILSLMLCLPVILTGMFVFSKKRLRALLTLGIEVAVALVIFLIFKEEIMSIVTKLLGRGFKDSGRAALRSDYMLIFNENWLLGGGFFTRPSNYVIGHTNDPYSLNLAHSLIVMIFSGAGILGAIAFAWHYYAQYKVLFSYKSIYTFFVFCALGMFLFYSLLDNSLYFVYQIFLLLVLLQGAQQEYEQLPPKHPPEKKSKKYLLIQSGSFLAIVAVLIAFAMWSLVTTPERVTSEIQRAAQANERPSHLFDTVLHYLCGGALAVATALVAKIINNTITLVRRKTEVSVN